MIIRLSALPSVFICFVQASIETTLLQQLLTLLSVRLVQCWCICLIFHAYLSLVLIICTKAPGSLLATDRSKAVGLV